MSYISFNPYTGKEENTFDLITDEKLTQKLELADEAYAEWSTRSFESRAKVMHRLADMLNINKQYHAEIITREMGKPITQSIAEVEKCALVCRYYAENAEGFLASEKMESGAKESYVRYDSLGTVFAVMPWNFPYWQVFRFLAPNLMAGNCGLLKHSSNVPRCGMAIEAIIEKAGAPKGVFQNLLINYEQAQSVISWKGVHGVTLTGSNYAGYKVAEIAGAAGKKTVLELGGSDPFLVFPDADIESAAEVAVMARFQNTGQSCIAAKRFIIHEDVYNLFLDLFATRVNKMKAGDPLDPDTEIGPVARKDLLSELEYQVKQMVEQGGKIHTGGSRVSADSLILQPTIVTGLPHYAKVNREELFGPVVPVFSFASDEQAVQLANETPFGLGASVWTSDMERAGSIAARLETGTVAINGMVKSDPALPFGGIKDSGFGRELSKAGIMEFINVKTIAIFD
jgi:succinate-semialdehyde dehydrogenase / glutarate-semialdehyde dehydrogenase